MTEMKFGDLYHCDLSYSLDYPKNKIVPVVFLKTERACTGHMIHIFCRVGNPPSGRSRHPYILLKEQEGLKYDSAVFPTQTVSIANERAILRKTGQIRSDTVKDLIMETAQGKRGKEKEIVMNLCPRCRRDFLTDTDTVVRRQDPFSRQAETCDFCQTRMGYTYVVSRRRYYRRAMNQ